ACSGPEKTEYTHAIPANVTEVAALNCQALAQKAGLGDAGNEAAKQKLMAALMDGTTPALAKQLEVILKDPAETGIDWSAPVYIFRAPSLHDVAQVAKVNDLSKLETLLGLLAEEKVCSAPEKADGYQTVQILNAGYQFAFNDGTLLITAGSPEQMKKLKPAITALMKQPADQSINVHKDYKQMMQQKGDIRFLASPSALPSEVRGVLTWPQGEQLLGNIQFEKGSIQATLQRAGFNGKTAESDQPTHPKSLAELQQTMLRIMHGTPFNLELTREELMTLSNLRILLEYAPDEPQVQALYQAILLIKTLTARGDNNRTVLTLHLEDNQRNALKQAVDFAKKLVGF
ncbi:MAG: DUF4836 family protein, partial [Bacteroides sp.]